MRHYLRVRRRHPALSGVEPERSRNAPPLGQQDHRLHLVRERGAVAKRYALGDMVRDDLEACVQAYQFAELLLSGLSEKEQKERQEALDAAQRLRDDVEPRYEAATSVGHRSEADLSRLKAARARLDEKLPRQHGLVL